MSGSDKPTNRPQRARLGRVLLEMGLISDEELADLLTRQRAEGGRLGELLIADKRLTPEQVAQAVAKRLGVEYLSMSTPPAAELVGRLAPDVARRYLALPARRDGDGTIVVAMADPTDLTVIDDLQLLLGESIRPGLAMPEAIIAHIGVGGNVEALAAEMDADASEPVHIGEHDVAVGENDGPVIRFVNTVIARAVSEGASDIHMEPQQGELMVRFRIDGLLRAVTSVPISRGPAIISRLKVLAELDIAERRVPQDGRVAIRVGRRALDLRIATLPIVGGESVVIRILDQSNAMVDIGALGFSKLTVDRYEQAFTQMHGLVLVTGPTGSGKTSTLYATLHRLNGVERKIMTVEDPVEYRLAGVNQVQVRPKAGLTFASGLRSMLRCDPDVIMIGEVRDVETARIAVEAALTGHLVLATLHTNDAGSAIARLTEMGIEPFLITSAVRGVLAQRLVRRLCPACKEPFPEGEVSLQEIVARHSLQFERTSTTLFRARGCAECSGSGYRGRFSVAEALLMSPSIERLTLGRSSPSEIALQAQAEGMRPMLEDGLQAVIAGETSLDELTRVVH